MRYKSVNKGNDLFDVVDTMWNKGSVDVEIMVSGLTNQGAYTTATAMNHRWHMDQPEHTINFGTERVGGRTWGGGGGFYRESEVYCSCGWSEKENGQTYAESAAAAREHLKEMGVWNTESDKTIYAHVGGFVWVEGQRVEAEGTTVAQLVEKTGKSRGIVERSLSKMVERGNIVVEYDESLDVKLARYRQTDKWFSWGL